MKGQLLATNGVANEAKHENENLKKSDPLNTSISNATSKDTMANGLNTSTIVENAKAENVSMSDVNNECSEKANEDKTVKRRSRHSLESGGEVSNSLSFSKRIDENEKMLTNESNSINVDKNNNTNNDNAIVDVVNRFNLLKPPQVVLTHVIDGKSVFSFFKQKEFL